MITYKLKS